MLFSAAIIWGFAFVAQRAGMEHTEPFFFNGVRFILGALFLIPVAFIYPKGKFHMPIVNRKYLLAGGCFAGSVLFIAATFQQIGMVYTKAGNAGFITSLYVIIVPFIGLFLNNKIDRQTWAGIILASFGLYLLSAKEISTPGSGDFLVLVSAFFFAAHVQIIGRISSKHNPILLSIIQFTVCSVISLVVSVFTENIRTEGIRDAAIPILYSGIMSVGVAYTLQTISQRKANPTHAAMILSTESVFALFGGWLILNEVFSVQGIFGCMLMLTGILLSQIKVEHRIRKSANPR